MPDAWPYRRSVPYDYAMMMRPNKAETAVHGCRCPGDVAVGMRKELVRPWITHNTFQKLNVLDEGRGWL